MIIKRRKLKPKPKNLAPLEALNRMADIVETKGDAAMARTYVSAFNQNMLARLQSIAARAEKDRNWKFMQNSLKQASELYILASVLYERFPNSIILSDGAYDGLARFLLKNYDKGDTAFWNWYNITALGLSAGTGYDLYVKSPIPEYVFILTGQRIQEYHGEPPQDATPKLRRKLKRHSVGGKSGQGRAKRRRIRKSGGGD